MRLWCITNTLIHNFNSYLEIMSYEHVFFLCIMVVACKVLNKAIAKNYPSDLGRD